MVYIQPHFRKSTKTKNTDRTNGFLPNLKEVPGALRYCRKIQT